MPGDLVKETKKGFVWRQHYSHTPRKKIFFRTMLCHVMLFPLFVFLIYIRFVLQLFIESAQVWAEIGFPYWVNSGDAWCIDP